MMSIPTDNSPLNQLSIILNSNSIDDHESNVSSLIKRKLSMQIEAFQKSRPPTQKTSRENVNYVIRSAAIAANNH